MDTLLQDISLDIIILTLFSALMIVFFISITFFSKKKKMIRKLNKISEKNIGSLKQHESTKITGKTVAIKEPFSAPLTNRKCVFYIFKIQKQKTNGKNKYWKTIVNEEKIQEFFIEKNGDLVMIVPTENPKNYKSYLVEDKKLTSTSRVFNGPSEELDVLLKKYNIQKNGFLGGHKSLRCLEAIIEVGERTTVAGIVKLKSLSKPIEGYSYSKITAIESNSKQKIIITDLKSITEQEK